MRYHRRKLGVFLEGRARTESGAVANVYDSFISFKIIHEENGVQEIIPTCQLAVHLDGKTVSKEPYEFKAPKVTMVYRGG